MVQALFNTQIHLLLPAPLPLFNDGTEETGFGPVPPFTGKRTVLDDDDDHPSRVRRVRPLKKGAEIPERPRSRVVWCLAMPYIDMDP